MKKPEDDRRPPKRPPGYFECRRILDRLHRYYDLACHSHNWAGLPKPRRSLAELLPGIPTEDKKGPDGRVIESARMLQVEALRQARTRLTKLVWEDLRRVGIRTEASQEVMEFDWDKAERRPKPRSFDLVVDYPERYPHSNSASGERMLFETLEHGIGYYETLRDEAFRDLFNPLNWIAALLRAPVYVLERARLIERGTPAYPWIAKTSMTVMLLLVLRLLAAWFGVSIDLKSVLAPLDGQQQEPAAPTPLPSPSTSAPSPSASPQAPASRSVLP